MYKILMNVLFVSINIFILVGQTVCQGIVGELSLCDIEVETRILLSFVCVEFLVFWHDILLRPSGVDWIDTTIVSVVV